MDYVELHSRSAFSFLRGGSSPAQLARRAAELQMPALGLCDRDGFYGAPRFFAAAKEHGVRPIFGAELTLDDGTVLPLLVETRAGYQNLCRLLTRAKLRGTKTASAVQWTELAEFAAGLFCLTGDEEGPLHQALAREDTAGARTLLHRLRGIFGPGRVFIEVQRHLWRGEDRLLAAAARLAHELDFPLLATNGVCYARPAERQVLDVFTCVRHHTHLDAAGRLLGRNSARCLKSSAQMQRLCADLPPEAIANTVRLAERLEFSLEDLGYQFPVYKVPAGETMESFLRRVTLEGARGRYGQRLKRPVLLQLKRELDLINKLGFAGYFLIVWDLVNFCRQTNVMVQGRGSAANSAVCYSLGITACDPIGGKLLFERFLSEGRKSWPDIDLDLPSGDRRESVIQEVYRRYGKHGAAMTANVITYRGRSAMREIGKALHFTPDIMDRFSRLFANGDFPHTLELADQMKQAGAPADHPRTAVCVALYTQIYGLPRHLGQHSGGMIICEGKLDAVVPLENASMPGRVVAQWDKDDCEDLGIIKVDLLGLGMMSVLQDTIELCGQRGKPVDLAQIDTHDAATYELMCRADTIGVFQIESRAQMATLPRMQPKCFYDVVIEVAIIRPGPIQGNMVHPYLKRRDEARRGDPRSWEYFDERLEPVLQRTLGVPLFQEQLLKIAMVIADFSGSEAEELRRALSFHRSQERMQKCEVKLRAAMARKGVAPDKVEAIIGAISSFALYGFPESHAISFAILAYGSAWLKVHRAPEFFASLLNNQPMGFYTSATLVNDARRHGVKTRPVCVQRSEWRCTIEADNSVRLGFCVVSGLSAARAGHLLRERARTPFRSMPDFLARAGLDRDELRTLAALGALNALAEHRRAALWQAEKPLPAPGDLFQDLALPAERSSTDLAAPEPIPLAAMTHAERLAADFSGMRLTTGPHAMALLRPHLPPGIWRAADLAHSSDGETLRIAGNVICRQRPGTAKGFVFISLEDETGIANAIVTPRLFEAERLVITQEAFLLIEGQVQHKENTILIRAARVVPLPHASPAAASHDFR
jgi:error-prone DNA polymerase